MVEKKALGRGLAALIPQRTEEPAGPAGDIVSQARQDGAERWLYKGKEVAYLSVEEIKPNRFQPRKDFKDDKLKELTDSIKQKGLLQPILVRQVSGGGFEILAGERRWRAVRALGIDRIPAMIKETEDAGALEISLIENLQRDDLNPLEEARAYKRLMDEFGLDVDKISQVVGKATSSVSNMLRLLGLSQKAQDALFSGLITTGHAKAILALKDVAAQERLCKRIIDGGLSVREAESLASGSRGKVGARQALKKDAEIVAVEEDLQRVLGTKVRVLAGKRGGRVVIEYFSNSDLERILNLLKGGLRA